MKSNFFFGDLCGYKKSEAREIENWFKSYRKELTPEINFTLLSGKFIIKFLSFISRRSVSEIQHKLESSKIAPLRGSSLVLRLIATLGFYSTEKGRLEAGFSTVCSPSPRIDLPSEADHPPDGVIEGRAVVVGTGAGGASAAYELAKNGVDTVIIEEGKEWMSGKDFCAIPPSRIMENLYINRGLTTTFGNTFILLPTARGVGGTTTINSGTCFRIPERVLDNWILNYQTKTLEKMELNDLFNEIENDLGVEPVKEENLGESARIVRAGAEEMGLNFRPLRRNAPGCKGCGRCAFGCPEDAKNSMNISYVPMALKRNARLYTGIRVKRAVIKNGKVQYLEAESFESSIKRKYIIRGEIYFIGAGALNTPYLLKASGVKNSYLGKNLTIHPATRVVGIMDREVRGWDGVPQGAFMDDLADEGISLEGIFVPPFAAAVNFPFSGKELREKIKEEYRRASAFGLMISDEDSEGRLFYTPKGRPLMYYNIGKKDFYKLIKGIRTLAELYFKAGAKKVYVPIRGYQIIRDISEIRKIDENKLKPRDLELGAFHPKGTVFMGGDFTGSPVDESGRVRGVENLIVVDTSVMPTSLGVNPQITCMALSRFFVRKWLDRGTDK